MLFYKAWYKTIYIRIIIILFAIVLLGCTEKMLEQFGEMYSIRKALVKEFNVPDVHLKISNGEYLTLSIINSTFNKFEPKEQEKKAQEIALFCLDYLSESTTIEVISVSFVFHKNTFGMIRYTQSIGTYSFNVDTLKSEKQFLHYGNALASLSLTHIIHKFLMDYPVRDIAHSLLWSSNTYSTGYEGRNDKPLQYSLPGSWVIVYE